MICYRASWVLPISSPPIRDGWVLADRDRIVSFGSTAEARGIKGARPNGEIDLGGVVLMPGLVNAHTHLELSHLRDAVPPSGEFVSWARGVMASRRQQPDPRADDILAGIRNAITEAVASGTAVVGDISNTLAPFGPLVDSPLAAVLFYELIRFRTDNPTGLVEDARSALSALESAPRVRVSLAAHAPYSVAPRVFQAIRQAIDREPSSPCSVHLAESAEELEFIRSASGPWRTLLEELGSWDPEWVAPGVSPVHYLDEAGFLDARVLAVHGVQMTAEDLKRLAARGTTLVACPRSNRHTGAGAPPIDEFYASGVRVAVGTDSLASTPDLNLFSELAAMRALAPSVPASRLLASATVEGARALGFGADYGSIEPGKSSRLIAVDLPAHTRDVEEYLVSGVQPGQVRWLDA